MAHKFTTSYLEDSISLFRYYKKMAEGAIEQVTDEQLFATLDAEMNSIAIIVKHMTGNMRSRWTDFLTSDGEKPDRNRDTEFEQPPSTRAELMQALERRLGTRIRRPGAAFRCRPGSHRHHSRRTAFGDAGHQPPDRALLVSRRTDCVPGQAPQRQRMEIADACRETNRRNSIGK